MEDRPLRVPATEDPRFINNAMHTGLSLSRFGSLAAFVATNGFIVGTGMCIIGVLGGGLYGKNRMEQEQLTGRLVEPPTIVNRGIINGASDGLLAGAILAIALSLPIISTVVAATAIGSVIGCAFTYSKMQTEYRAAKAYVAKYGEFDPRTNSKTPIIEQNLTPEEAMILEKTLAKQGQSHAERVGNAINYNPEMVR